MSLARANVRPVTQRIACEDLIYMRSMNVTCLVDGREDVVALRAQRRRAEDRGANGDRIGPENAIDGEGISALEQGPDGERLVVGGDVLALRVLGGEGFAVVRDVPGAVAQVPR